MARMAAAYSPGCWTCIGPELLTAAVAEYTALHPDRGDITTLPLERWLSNTRTLIFGRIINSGSWA